MSHTYHASDGRYNLPIPSPDTTPLSQLIATLSTQTHVPADQLKVIFNGAVLKDTSLTLSAYGLKDGSQLALVGNKEGPPTAPSPAPQQQVVKKKNKQPETDSQDVLTDWIDNLVKGIVEPLEPAIVTFVSQTSSKATNKPKHIPAFDVLQREHARLSEMLLRGLLDLDNITIPSEWTDARQARKMGVRRVQGELDKVDGAWGERKRIGA